MLSNFASTISNAPYLCSDVVSQGADIEEALAKLKEAIELLCEVGGEAEVQRHLDQIASVPPLDLELVAAWYSGLNHFHVAHCAPFWRRMALSSPDSAALTWF
jgi:predicted RNase H-like HicB family nuclease